MKTYIVFCLTLMFLVGPAVTAYPQSSSAPMYYGDDRKPSDWDMVVDVTLARPMGFLGTLCGLVVSVAALPFSVPSGSTGQVFQKMVGEPFNFTFTRPVGDYSRSVPPSSAPPPAADTGR